VVWVVGRGEEAELGEGYNVGPDSGWGQWERRSLAGAWMAVPHRPRRLVVEGLVLWCGEFLEGWEVVEWQVGGWGWWRWLEDGVGRGRERNQWRLAWSGAHP